jgi:hypothetical protein
MNTAGQDPSAVTGPKRPARIVRKATRRNTVRAVPAPSNEPVPGFDEPAVAIVDDWMTAFEDIGESEGAFAIETYASMATATIAQLGRMAAAGFVDGDPIAPLLAELTRRRDAMSLSALECFGRLDDGEFGTLARLAAQAVRAQGVSGAVGGDPPAWIAELEQPCAVDECAEMRILGTSDRMLLLGFSRDGIRHGLAVVVDDAECGEAAMILPIEPSPVLQKKALAKAGKDLVEPGTRVKTGPLDPADALLRVETAISRRADHDANLGPAEILDELFAQAESARSPLDDEDGPPPYLPLLPLLASRLASLPPHGRELPPHPAETTARADLKALLESILAEGGLGARTMAIALGNGIETEFGTPFGAAFGAPFGSRRRKPLSAMPKKRSKSDGPAPVYRLRIDLKGAKPPIWRRLELTGDATLATVHQVIQTAFEWEDYHLHAFRTEYGPFGNGDEDSGHRKPASVTLEQLLRAPGDKLEYTYDFGYGWEHAIKLEAILEPEKGLKPRCTAGRRAVPPEDCGGIWGYEDDRGRIGPDSFDRDELNRILAETF